MEIPFEARGRTGSVNVSLVENDNPTGLGCPSWAHGFPVCEATVSFLAAGYDALLGWVQLVRMRSQHLTPNEQWVTDPLQVYEKLETPFGFYGIAPTLFDAPARSDRSKNLDWHAESFLCFAPSSPMANEVRPLAAFSWGFVLDDGAITMRRPNPISLSTWNEHLALLTPSYPSWTFIAHD